MPKKIIDEGLDDIRESGMTDDDNEVLDEDFEIEFEEAGDVDDNDPPVDIDAREEDIEYVDDPDPDEPDLEGDPDAGSDKDEDDQTSYSKNVQKRIAREIKLKEKARQEAEELRKRLAELEAKHSAESIDKRIDEAVNDLEDARRDADTRRETMAQAKINRLYAEKEDIETRAKNQPKESAKDEENPELDAWLSRNKWFDDDANYGVQRQAAIQIGRKLVEQGISDASPKFYQLLDKELRSKVRLPSSEGRQKQVRTTITREPGQEGRVSKGKVVLTAVHLAEMRRLQLDPNNKAHLREYAENVRKYG